MKDLGYFNEKEVIKLKNGERLLGKSAYRISSPFTNRRNPVTGKQEFHNGVDYATYGKKVPCFAPLDGEVSRVGKDNFGALFVYVKFSKVNKVGLYYHLDKIDVIKGQNLKAGDKVGIVGTTGQSTGVHLHFSFIENNKNALNYNLATYLDFEKFKFLDYKEEEDEYMVANKLIYINGKDYVMSTIEKDGRNFVEIADFNTTEDLKVSFDGTNPKIDFVKIKEFVSVDGEDLELECIKINDRLYPKLADFNKSKTLKVDFKNNKPTLDTKEG